VTTLDTLIDYKQLVEALADAVVVADPSGAIRFWNPAAERLLGFTEAEVLGNFATKLLDLPKTEIYTSGWPSSNKESVSTPLKQMHWRRTDANDRLHSG